MWRRLHTLAPALRRATAAAAAGAPAAPASSAAHAAPLSSAAAAFRRTSALSEDKPARVEDVMPIAMGLEHEELEAELQGKKRFDMDPPAGPFGTKGYLMRDLLAEQPTACTNSLMTVRCLQHCDSDNTDDDRVSQAFKRCCSTSASSGVSDASPCASYVENLCRSGNLVNAVCDLRQLHDEQVHVGLHTFNMLLQHTTEANSFPLFAKVFRYLLLSKLAPDSTSYMNVAKALQKLDDCELILKFVRELLEITHNRDPTVMNRIIFATAQYGHVDKSLVIFEELKKYQTSLDVVTFNTVLDMLGKAGRVDQMRREVKLMEELGHFPDIVTYNTIINCLRRLGRLDLCKSFAGEMLERGITPDLRTYTALIDSFGRSVHITDALEMFQKMKKSHQPSVYVYRGLISNLKKAGQFELAQKLTEDMNSSASELIGPEDFKPKNKGRRLEKMAKRPLIDI